MYGLMLTEPESPPLGTILRCIPILTTCLSKIRTSFNVSRPSSSWPSSIKFAHQNFVIIPCLTIPTASPALCRLCNLLDVNRWPVKFTKLAYSLRNILHLFILLLSQIFAKQVVRLLENCPSRRTGESRVVLQKSSFIKEYYKAA
jgi:hypothetical protein